MLQCGGGFLRTGDFAAFLADLGRQYAALDMACSAAAVLAASQAFDQPVYGLDLILFGDERLPARRAGQRVEDRAEDAAIEHDVGIHFLRFVFVYGRCGKAVLDHVERDVFDRVAIPSRVKLWPTKIIRTTSVMSILSSSLYDEAR